MTLPQQTGFISFPFQDNMGIIALRRQKSINGKCDDTRIGTTPLLLQVESEQSGVGDDSVITVLVEKVWEPKSGSLVLMQKARPGSTHLHPRITGKPLKSAMASVCMCTHAHRYTHREQSICILVFFERTIPCLRWFKKKGAWGTEYCCKTLLN